MKKNINKLFKKLGFQIVRYDDNKPKVSLKTNRLTLHNTATGNYYLPTDAEYDIVANTIINNKIFEENVVKLAKKYIKKDTLVLDIGSNFGQMSIIFSDLVGENGKVYSFEADDWIFEIFKKNIAANNKSTIIIPHYGAVHCKDGEILIFPHQDFREHGSYGSYGIDYNAKNGREVGSITIDSLNISEPISLIKIDIQGGDLNAMKGAIKTIQKNQCPIIFEYEYQFEEKFNLCFQDYVDFVQSINYKFHKVIYGHNFLIIPK